jgi:hypothetical protein
VADTALESHPHVIDKFLIEWDNYPSITPEQRERRRDWVRKELERVEAEGIAPLYFALTRPLAIQVDECLAVLSEKRKSVALRLVADASPPDTDPQGRPLPADKRGKVLVAKIGNISRDGMTGTKRLEPGRTLYECVEIGAEPSLLNLEEAAIVLRQWGVNVRSTEFYQRGDRRQSRYLVVQVRQDGTSFARPTTEPRRDNQQNGRK